MPWQGDDRVALVGPGRGAMRVTAGDVALCVDHLDSIGVTRAVTPALTRFDSQPFLDAGFVLLEHLHLLSRRIDDAPFPADRRIRRGRPWHRKAVLDIDGRAFEPFWRFDSVTLRESRRATPSSRFRTLRDGGSLVGYAVTGRAGRRGYLQRLAVDPHRSGEGIGTALVHDAIRWLQAHDAERMMVNTQERNQRALSLYEHLGFVREPEGLIVLERRHPNLLAST